MQLIANETHKSRNACHESPLGIGQYLTTNEEVQAIVAYTVRVLRQNCRHVEAGFVDVGDVVRPVALRTHPAPQKFTHESVLSHGYRHDAVDVMTFLQGCRLRHGAREPIRYEGVCGATRFGECSCEPEGDYIIGATNL